MTFDRTELTSSRSKVISDWSKVTSDHPKVSSDRPELASDRPKVTSDRLKPTSDRPEVSSDLPEVGFARLEPLGNASPTISRAPLDAGEPLCYDTRDLSDLEDVYLPVCRHVIRR